MSITSLPKVTAQLLSANAVVAASPFRVLICGVIGTDGNATTATPYSGVESLTNAQITTLFGTKSDLTNRIFRARDIIQGLTSIWVLPITQPAGTQANAQFTFTGIATSAGTIIVRAADAYYYTVSVSVSVGDTAATVATNVQAALAAYTNAPWTSSVVTSTSVKLLANDAGTIGNDYTVDVANVPAGITVASALGNYILTGAGSLTIQFVSGATDPTLTNYFANVTATRFHAISWPWSTATAAPVAFLVPRNTINNSFLQGVCFVGYDDTEANLKTLIYGATPLNNQNLIYVGNSKVAGTGGNVSLIITPASWRAVEVMSVVAVRMTLNAPIGKYVTVSSPLDQFGGSALASLALFNTPLYETAITVPENLFSETSQNNLVTYGYSIVGVNESRTNMITGQVMTTYNFNSLGQPDTSFKYYEYVLTGYLALEIFFKTLKSTYSQFRLTQGNVVSGRAITNSDQITATVVGIYQTLSGPVYALTQAGDAAQKYFYNNLTVSVTTSTGNVNISGQLPIVTQLRSFNIAFQMSFTIGS